MTQQLTVSDQSHTELMQGPCGDALSVYTEMHADAIKVAGSVAEARRLPLREFVSAISALALRQTAWSMLSACRHGCVEFDPVAFGQSAERLAREMIPMYAQTVEKPGAPQQ